MQAHFGRSFECPRWEGDLNLGGGLGPDRLPVRADDEGVVVEARHKDEVLGQVRADHTHHPPWHGLSTRGVGFVI